VKEQLCKTKFYTPSSLRPNSISFSPVSLPLPGLTNSIADIILIVLSRRNAKPKGQRLPFAKWWILVLTVAQAPISNGGASEGTGNANRVSMSIAFNEALILSNPKTAQFSCSYGLWWDLLLRGNS
jgi:hypothetical protein